MRILKPLDAFLSARSRLGILIVSLIFAVVLGVIDYFLRVDLLILYLVPVFLAGWYGGIREGSVIAIYCAASGFLTQAVVAGGKGVDAADLWSFLVRLASYLVIAGVVVRLQESRRQQQELTQFIVHDLRSPISSAITGLMTLEQSAEHLDPVDKEMVSLALVSNQRALTLVNSMLDVAKLETGKMEIRREHVAIRSFVDDCLRQVALWAQSHDIRLDAQVEVEAAELDPDLTSRVLVNLLSNALKFSPAGSTVTVSVLPTGAHGVRFGVHDQGPGVPPDYIDAIFEPFAQVKGTKGGTGLGLTFCRLAVQAQGGRIWVESKLGEGASMLFTLPSPHGAHHAPSVRATDEFAR